MLRGLDISLEFVAYSLAVFFVVLLFVGPKVVAEDKPTAQAGGTAGATTGKAGGGGGGGGNQAGGGSEAVDGKAVFTDNCGSCHTLSAAGTSGTVGPNLDDVSLDAATIQGIVESGRGGMPSFSGQLSDAEITAVAAFVAGK